MSIAPLTQGLGGLALALSFAQLGPWRLSSSVALCAAQASLVGVAALAQGDAGLAGAELVQAGMLAWATHAGWLPRLHDADHRPPGMAPRLAAAAGLAALATMLPTAGVPLAIVLLGVLLLIEPRPARQALGVVSLQAGLTLGAMVGGLTGWQQLPAAMPWLPAAAIIGLWLGNDRRAAGALRGTPLAAQAETALCLLALLGACALPWWLGRYPPIWRLDAQAAQVILLLCLLAASAAWSRRASAPVLGSRLIILLGTGVAVLSAAPLVSWLGMAMAALAAAIDAMPRRAEAWRRLLQACTGLGLVLFGAMASHAGPTLAAAGLIALGSGILAILAPELTVAAIALVIRTPTPQLLPVAGLAGLLLAALGLLTRRATLDRLPLVDLAQGSVAVFAFGLGTPAGNLAGLLQLSLLALTRCAILLAPPDGLESAAALAGLAGVPPFGLFASLMLVLTATAGEAPWLLLPLGAGLGVTAWSLLRHLPDGRRLTPSPAWLPLVLALVCGLAMPAPLLAWFRMAAR